MTCTTGRFRFVSFACAAAAGCALLSGCASADAAGSAPAAAVELKSTSWMLPVPKDSECKTNPMLEFTAGEVSGDLGCNLVNGTYKIDGNRLTFGPLAVTGRMCAPDFMKLEETMLKAINGVATVERTEKELIFFDASGRELVRLVPEQAGACD